MDRLVAFWTKFCISGTLALLALVIGAILSVVFGVHALQPEPPWKKRDIAAGLYLILYSGFVGAGCALVVFLVVAALAEFVHCIIRRCTEVKEFDGSNDGVGIVQATP